MENKINTSALVLLCKLHEAVKKEQYIVRHPHPRQCLQTSYKNIASQEVQHFRGLDRCRGNLMKYTKAWLHKTLQSTSRWFVPFPQMAFLLKIFSMKKKNPMDSKSYFHKINARVTPDPVSRWSLPSIVTFPWWGSAWFAFLSFIRWGWVMGDGLMMRVGDSLGHTRHSAECGSPPAAVRRSAGWSRLGGGLLVPDYRPPNCI